MDGNITRAEFLQEKDRIHSRLNEHESKIAVLETVIKNFEGLPNAINSLEKTMIRMEENLKELNKQVAMVISTEEKLNSAQDKKIEEIANNSKVDIMAFIKSKWWEIVMFAAMAVLLLKDKLK